MFRLLIQDERRVTNSRTSPHLANTTTIDTKYDCGVAHIHVHAHAKQYRGWSSTVPWARASLLFFVNVCASDLELCCLSSTMYPYCSAPRDSGPKNPAPRSLWFQPVRSPDSPETPRIQRSLSETKPSYHVTNAFRRCSIIQLGP